MIGELDRDGAPAKAAPRVAGRVIAATSLAALAASIAVVLALRELGRSIFDLSGDLAPLSTAALIPATLLPVVGNSVGFFISFSLKPSRYSMRLFLGVGAVMTIAGIVICTAELPSAAGTGAITTAVAASVAPVLVTVPALLLLLRGTGRRQAHHPRSASS